MIKVHFLGPIGLDSMEIECENFTDLKARLGEIEALKEWIPLCAVALNDKIIQNPNEIVFKNNDEISLLPPVCGG